MFELTIGYYTFQAKSAQELAGTMHELLDENIDDTLKMCRELKRDIPHVVMVAGSHYTVEKIA